MNKRKDTATMKNECCSCKHFIANRLYSGDCKLHDVPTHFKNTCENYEKDKDLESRLARMELALAGKKGK